MKKYYGNTKSEPNIFSFFIKLISRPPEHLFARLLNQLPPFNNKFFNCRHDVMLIYWQIIAS